MSKKLKSQIEKKKIPHCYIKSSPIKLFFYKCIADCNLRKSCGFTKPMKLTYKWMEDDLMKIEKRKAKGNER